MNTVKKSLKRFWKADLTKIILMLHYSAFNKNPIYTTEFSKILITVQASKLGL